MKNHPFILEPYKGMNSRYRCPNCNKERSFTRYIDSNTGEHVNPDVGRCNRENNCGYHYTPKQYFSDHNITREIEPDSKRNHPIVPIPEKPASHVPFRLLRASLHKHEDNHFIQYLDSLFGKEITGELIRKYFIGSSRHWEGSTVFWQMDIEGKIRSGKVMLYDPVSGKRVKEPFNHITWVHKLIGREEFVLKQCLYGDHLLKDKTKPVALVESEKTAIIASVYLPQFTWLAAGSLNNLNPEICEVLDGRFVALFPDLNASEKWSRKAEELSEIATFVVSDLLERKTNEEDKRKGLDLADYLIRYNYTDFTLPEPLLQVEAILPFVDPFEETLDEKCNCIFIELRSSDQPEEATLKPWDQEIAALEAGFNLIDFPNIVIQLNAYTKITDPSVFIRSHLEIIKANNGNTTFLPYLTRLRELMQLLSKSLN